LRTRYILLTFVCFNFACQAAAQDDQVVRGPAPEWVNRSELRAAPADASGLVFVRRNDILVHLDERGQSNFVGVRIKILHPNALRLGNIALTWNPASGTPTVHAIRIYRGDEAIDVLQSARFEVIRREDQLEASVITGLLTAILRVSDLRVGDEIEYEFTTPGQDPALENNSAGILFLAPEPPPGRFRLGVSWTQGAEPRLQWARDLESSAVRSGQTLLVSLDDPVALAPPNDAPPRYSWQRIVEFSDFADWAAISSYFSPLYLRAAQLEANSPLRAEAARIAAAHSEPIDRAKAALAMVQSEIRYIFVGLNTGNLVPASADDTWRRRYGDCKGKTVLLLALLAELGISAEPVLVNNSGADDGLDQRLPQPGMFDHVLVRATIDGHYYWMDGTLPSVAEPSVNPIAPYRWVLPLTSAGTNLERLEWKPATRPEELTLFEIDARAGFDVPARIVQTTIARGIPGLAQQVQFSPLTESQLTNGIRQQYIGDTWQTIDKVTWRYDREAQASILQIEGSGDVAWEGSQRGRSLVLPGGGFNPPPRRIRPPNQDQTAPFYSAPSYNCSVTTVRIPDSTEPSQWSFNTSFNASLFGRYHYRQFGLSDRSIRMIRGSRAEAVEISAADAQRDNALISDFDNSTAQITYVAGRTRHHDADLDPTPSTYDLDWTADNVPCLGPPSTVSTTPQPLAAAP
jgi:transglutaminase-like putative cysteine protease